VAEGDTAHVAHATLREVVETLAAIERPPCSAGERRAAAWIADRLEAAGCREVAVEIEPARDGYLQTAAVLGIVAAGGALLALSGRQTAGALLATAAGAALVDDVQNGPRLARRVLRREQTTVNVVARAGDPAAPRTLVVLAHHDAHQSGRFYDQSLQQAIHARWPALIDRLKTSPPQWWLGLAGPVLTLASAVTGCRRAARAGLGFALLGTAIVGEIASNPTTPGANDNLSGVAGLVGLAELLDAEPLQLNVLLVSCGAEEALQEGARAFATRHRADLTPRTTFVVNLETIGSERLILLEGEGPIWMEDYADPGFRDLIAKEATDSGLERGFRARASTDSVILSRTGCATATLTSLTSFGTLANYHLQTDTPDNVDHATVARAVALVHRVGRRLAED